MTGSSNEFIVRHPDTFEEVRKIATPGSWLAFAPDGRTLFAQKLQYDADELHQITRWDLERGKELPAIPLPIEKEWPSCRLSFDGKILFVKNQGEPPMSGRTFDIETSKELPRQGHSGAVGSVAINREGTLVASGGVDRTVKLWNVATGTLEHTLTGHTDNVTGVAFSPDGKTLATAGREGLIKLWDVAVTSDGRYLAISSESGLIQILRVPEFPEADAPGSSVELPDPFETSPSARMASFLPPRRGALKIKVRCACGTWSQNAKCRSWKATTQPYCPAPGVLTGGCSSRQDGAMAQCGYGT